MTEKGRPERSPGREQQSRGRPKQSQGRPDKPRDKQPEDDERIERITIAFVGDDKPAQSKAPDDVRTEPENDPEPATKSTDGSDYHVLWVKVVEDIQFAQNLFILKTLEGAEAQIITAVEEGYWVYGIPYFQALLDAIDELRDKHQKLKVLAQKSIDSYKATIAIQISIVQEKANETAKKKLQDSREQVLRECGRYLRDDAGQPFSESLLVQVLNSPPTPRHQESYGFPRPEPVFVIARFDEEALGKLMVSLWTLREYHRGLKAADSELAGQMDTREMREVTAKRKVYLEGFAPAIRPSRVPNAAEIYPEPSQVTAARASVVELAAALEGTQKIEGAIHPVLFRIWDPVLAEKLPAPTSWKLPPGLAAAGVTGSSIPVFDSAGIAEFKRRPELQWAIDNALRTTWQASNKLENRITNEPGHCWCYPPLIEMTLRAMQVAIDSFAHTVAEHHLQDLRKRATSSERRLMRASEVLTVASLALRFIPHPAATVTAGVLTAVDLAIGGLGTLAAHLQVEEVRDAFRAFLVPEECFVVSDGDPIGAVVATAFLLFGVATFRSGLSRATLLETAITGGAISLAEHLYPEYPELSKPSREQPR